MFTISVRLCCFVNGTSVVLLWKYIVCSRLMICLAMLVVGTLFKSAVCFCKMIKSVKKDFFCQGLRCILCSLIVLRMNKYRFHIKKGSGLGSCHWKLWRVCVCRVGDAQNHSVCLNLVMW